MSWLPAVLLAFPKLLSWRNVESTGRVAVRWLSVHTGVPALVVAAVLVVVGYRVLKKSLRFFLEVALVAALLVAAAHAGWLRF
ncbi:MAG: hypothetical protein JWP97_5022 [Labilithrix sp.]|nr:hypothetical protein [Labilithrix sp.]